MSFRHRIGRLSRLHKRRRPINCHIPTRSTYRRIIPLRERSNFIPRFTREDERRRRIPHVVPISTAPCTETTRFVHVEPDTGELDALVSPVLECFAPPWYGIIREPVWPDCESWPNLTDVGTSVRFGDEYVPDMDCQRIVYKE